MGVFSPIRDVGAHSLPCRRQHTLSTASEVAKYNMSDFDTLPAGVRSLRYPSFSLGMARSTTRLSGRRFLATTSLWVSIGKNAHKAAIQVIVLFESDFLQEGFSQHGSTFHADCVGEELRQRPLHADSHRRTPDGAGSYV